jgi:hypothetical protein
MDRVKRGITEVACAQVFREAGRPFASHERDPVGDSLERDVGQASSCGSRAARWLRAMFLAFALGCMSIAIAQTASPPAPPAPPIPVEQMRAFGYTKEFAQRFALPEPEPGWEPGEGLLAVEFRVRPISGGQGLHNCDFKLYIDGKLDIAFPEPGLSGSSRLYTDLTHPFIARGKGVPDIPEVDRRARFERQSAFLQLSAFATEDYVPGKRGALVSSGPLEFVRDLFPGVHYMDAANCSFPSWLSRGETGVKVWVKKSSGKDYRRDLAQDPNDFYQFALPPALIAKARPWAEWVSQNNHFVDEKDGREQRERHYGTRNREPENSGTR